MVKERKSFKTIAKQFLAGVLGVAMAVSLIPTSASVVQASYEVPNAVDTDGLELSKSIELQEDGTYKIKMEAYATGDTTVESKTEAVPLDIVLVLDQSGSMSYDFGEGTTVSGYKESYCSDRYKTMGNDWLFKAGGNYYNVKKKTTTTGGRWPTTQYVIYYTNNSGLNVDIKSYSSENSQIDMKLYKQTTETVKKARLDALIDSANTFVDLVKSNGETNKVQHRIAVAGFASSNFKNTELLSGCEVKNGSYYSNNKNSVASIPWYYPKGYNYVGSTYNSGDGYTADLTTAMQNINDNNGAGYNNVKNAISYLTAYGGTQTDDGMKMAKDIIDNRQGTTYTNNNGETKERQTIVVLFTDGEPTGTGSRFNNEVAANAISSAKILKDSNTKIFSVCIYDSANSEPITDKSSNINKFMHFVSSNYPVATSMETRNNGSRANQSDYYKVASDAGELEDVFSSIAYESTTSSTSVHLDSTAVLKDTISEYFDIAGVQSVNAYTVTGTQDGDNIAWGTTSTAVANNNVSLDSITKTISVTGFDYSREYIAASHPGKKLVVEATVTANEKAAGLASVPSNVGPTGDESNVDGSKGDGAGVYATSTDDSGNTTYTPAEYFEVPRVTVPSNAYVLDFGKKVTIDKSEYSEVAQFNKLGAAMNASAGTADVTGNFGITSFNNDTNRPFSYTPTTFCWNGIDTVYGLGTLTADAAATADQSRQWYQTRFIPATSVYYEDDFGTGTSNDSSVNIIYSGAWSTDGTSEDSEQSYHSVTDSSQDNYGWDAVYSTDSGYSNGSAHKVNGQTSYEGSTATKEEDKYATAEFTFTGTAVDIYSRTNIYTGQILAEVYKVADGKETMTAMKVVDNLYESGDLYQIPTLALDMPEYGTYKVVLTVSTDVTAHDTAARSDYYLDGIRVYNPMGLTGGDAADYYTNDGENNPLVVEFRDILLNKASATNAISSTNQTLGAIFIDELHAAHTQTTAETGAESKALDETTTETETPAETEMIVEPETTAPVETTVDETATMEESIDGIIEDGAVAEVPETQAQTEDLSAQAGIVPETEEETVVADENAIAKVAATDPIDWIETYTNWGPKNEVYLENGQSVAFKIDTDLLESEGTSNTKVMVGIKAPNGEAKYQVNSGDVFTLNSATDMYYVVEPETDGSVIIENVSGEDSKALIALTKIKVTDASSALMDITYVDDGLWNKIVPGTTSTGKVVEAEPVTGESKATSEAFTGDVTVNNQEEPETEEAGVTIETIWKDLADSVSRFLAK